MHHTGEAFAARIFYLISSITGLPSPQHEDLFGGVEKTQCIEQLLVPIILSNNILLAAAAAHACIHVLYVACNPPLLVSLIYFFIHG